MSVFHDAIDPTNDPEGGDSFQDELESPAPILDTPVTFLTLPGGWTPTLGGPVLRDVEVRELTGIDEEALAGIVASSQAGTNATWVRLRRAILERGLVAIGEYKAVKVEQIAKQLFLGDLDAILLGIRIATYGPDFEANIFCTGCNKQVSIVFELDKDIEYKTCDNPYNLTSVGLRNGSTAVIRRPTADDQDYAFDGNSNPAEVNSKLLDRVLVAVDGSDMITYPGGGLAYVRKLGIRDRQELSKAVRDMEYGPNLREVGVECPENCGSRWTGALSLPALF